jgi:membrane protease YdiL (CAAX protease family)
VVARDFDTLGLRLRAEPSWRFWWIAAALIALAVGVISAGYVVVTDQYDLVSFRAPDSRTWRQTLPIAVIFAPVFEELVFRLALCSTLVAWIGRWPTVVVAGSLFGAIHLTNGVAGPDNMVAGYFMTWAFLRSGSLAVPLGLHAGGNLIVVLLGTNPNT